MKVQVIGHWSSSLFGTRVDGEVFEAQDDANTRSMIQRGYLREYETKVVHQAPKKPLTDNDAGSSPAAPVARKPKKSSKPKTKEK